jgi:hypothetical protein
VNQGEWVPGVPVRFKSRRHLAVEVNDRASAKPLQATSCKNAIYAIRSSIHNSSRQATMTIPVFYNGCCIGRLRDQTTAKLARLADRCRLRERCGRVVGVEVSSPGDLESDEDFDPL